MGHKRLVTADPSANYPEFLKKAYSRNQGSSAIGEPIVINMGQQNAEMLLQQLISQEDIREVIDNYGEQYAELLLSKNAHLYRANHSIQEASIKKLLDEHYGSKSPWKMGSWVFYPWTGHLVHVLAQEDFETLRTIRNWDLIDAKEQQKLFDFEVACFGMSVGSAGAQAMAITGISRRIKLIDGAVISGSNLNRILTGVSSVGTSKAVIIGQQIYEMNPYASIERTDRVTAGNIDSILDKPWPTKLIIDEIDDIEMKIRIRTEARKRHIPVIMATELGDTIMIDVERYDLEPNRPLFHDIIPGIEEAAQNPPENHREWMKHAVKIIGPKNMPIKMQQSLLKIGSTIVTHPQLGSTVMMTGGALAFVVKSIALGNKIDSGRHIISLENSLLTDHGTRAHKQKHKKHTRIIESAIKSM